MILEVQFQNFGAVFSCDFKNTDQNNICASIVFKAKTKERYEHNFLWFLFQNSKMPFFGGQPIFFLNFFSVLAFKTNIILISIF